MTMDASSSSATFCNDKLHQGGSVALYSCTLLSGNVEALELLSANFPEQIGLGSGEKPCAVLIWASE